MCRVQSVTLFLAAFLLLPPTSSADSKYSGTVVAGGQPVAGAKVWLRSYNRTKATRLQEKPENEECVETRTDAAGRFTVTGPKGPDVRPIEIIARTADGRIGWLSLFRHGTEDVPVLRLELYAVGAARGRLTDAAGKPLAGVLVQVRSFGIHEKETPSYENYHEIPGPLRRLFETMTGTDGSFVLRGVPLGSLVHASVSAPRYGDPGIFWMQDKFGDFRLERGGRVRLHFSGAANPRQPGRFCRLDCRAGERAGLSGPRQRRGAGASLPAERAGSAFN